MSWDDLLKWYPHVLTVGGLFMAFLLLRARGEFATKTDLSALATEVKETSRRVEIVEREMSHLPKREDIHALHLKLTEVQGDLREMRAEAEGDRGILGRVEAALQRHEDVIAAVSRAGSR